MTQMVVTEILEATAGEGLEAMTVDGRYWVGDLHNPSLPKTSLEEMEQGKLALDTPVRIQPDAEPRPLYKYIRELVWEEYQVEGKEGPSTWPTAACTRWRLSMLRSPWW